jgi:hypothetical protein
MGLRSQHNDTSDRCPFHWAGRGEKRTLSGDEENEAIGLGIYARPKSKRYQYPDLATGAKNYYDDIRAPTAHVSCKSTPHVLRHDSVRHLRDPSRGIV